MTQLEYLLGFLDFMQDKGVLNESDFEDYNLHLSAQRDVNTVFREIFESSKSKPIKNTVITTKFKDT